MKKTCKQPPLLLLTSDNINPARALNTINNGMKPHTSSTRLINLICLPSLPTIIRAPNKKNNHQATYYDTQS